MKTLQAEQKRVIQLRDLLQMSQVEFAEKIHITQGALSQIENGRTNISLETLKKICSVLNINSNWVITGKGDIFMKEDSFSSSKEIQKVIITADNNNKNYVPLVKQEAHAGYIKGFEDTEFIKTLEVYQIPGFSEGNYRLFEIEGDSMIPAISPRELVVCEFIEDWGKLENGSLCVIISEEGIVAKRIYYYENDKNILILKSDNSNFKTFSMPRSRVFEIWQIRAKITSVFAESGSVDVSRIEKLELGIEQLKLEVKRLANR